MAGVRAWKMVLATVSCSVLCAGCGHDSAARKPSAGSARKAAAAMDRAGRKLAAGRPASSTLVAKRARYAQAARRALGSGHATVTVSAPATVLVKSTLRLRATGPSASELHRLRDVCVRVHRQTAGVQILVTDARGRELYRCDATMP